MRRNSEGTTLLLSPKHRRLGLPLSSLLGSGLRGVRTLLWAVLTDEGPVKTCPVGGT